MSCRRSIGHKSVGVVEVVVKYIFVFKRDRLIACSDDTDARSQARQCTSGGERSASDAKMLATTAGVCLALVAALIIKADELRDYRVHTCAHGRMSERAGLYGGTRPRVY